MRITRATHKGAEFYCVLDGEIVHRLKGAPFDAVVFSGEDYFVDEVILTLPVLASKIVAVGKNYREHAKEMGEGEPDEPLLFLKPNTTLIPSGSDIIYPVLSRRVDYEGELGVIIGKRCKNVPENEAQDVIFGFTCLNDVTARDIQKSDPQWTRGKSFDTFCPIGPHIETELKNHEDLAITTRLNGAIRQQSRTANMTHSISKLIAYITQVMTLLPGDIIATGTPEGVGEMSVGDIVEVEVEGIGVLRNKISM